MAIYNKKDFKIDSENFSIFSNKNIFKPNFTTKLLIEAAKKIIKKNDKVLDLGCGTGIIGCYFFEKKITKFIYGSDLSSAAVKCSIYNAKKLTDSFDIRLSNLLDEWRDEKFNLIINDV
jgi:methylase of polypeptide subunit release factors